MTEIEQAVQRGAQVLDHFYPDWEFRINLDARFDVEDVDHCTLACIFSGYANGTEQVFGERGVACAKFFAIKPQVEDCGFAVDSALGYFPSARMFRQLTTTWRDLVTRRRTAAQTHDTESMEGAR